MHPAKNHERARLETPRQSIRLRSDVRVSIVVLLKDIERDEQLRSDFVAPAFDAMIWNDARFGVGDGGLAKPDVRELVCQREHLSGFAIGTVQEYERRQRLRQG